MRILAAPDKFKDALTAQEVCTAIATGVRRARPDAQTVACPLGDGGEGTGQLLAEALGATQHTARVRDPLGRERAAHFWLCADSGTAVVEMAQASGLCLLAPRERSATRATSYGTGQLLRAAGAARARRVLVCVGGSATVDGGAGCLQALGWQLRDASGRIIAAPACGGLLHAVRSVCPPAQPPALEIEVLCDVDNPLLGPRGAADVFAPQKGAGPPEVEQLAAGLASWADVLTRDCGRDPRAVSGSGAAGGLPFGLAAALNARLVSGFERLADHVQLDRKLHGCDLCFTGEGRLDEQTAAGKVVAGVGRRARSAGVPAVALVGAVRQQPGDTPAQLAEALGLHAVVVITPEGTPPAEALTRTAENLQWSVADYLAAGA